MLLLQFFDKAEEALCIKENREDYVPRRFIPGRPATLLKKRLWHGCFPVNFAKFLKNTFFTEHLWATASVYFKGR